MLKINKNQIKKGQQVVTTKDIHLVEWTSKWNSRGGIQRTYKPNTNKNVTETVVDTLPAGSVLTITSASGTQVSVTSEHTTDYKYNAFNSWNEWWSEFKTYTDLGDFPNLGAQVVEYKMLLNGVDFKKKKFKDIGKIKASLMSMMGYHSKFAKVAKQYYDRCPENQEGVYYVYESYGDSVLNRSQFAQLELFEVLNNKMGKKVDLDFVGYYNEMIKFLSVSATFGPATRDCFKKALLKEDYTTILVYVPVDYDQHDSYDYQYLKENQTIKDAMKASKVKGTIKSSKCGKTAIAFKHTSDVFKVIQLLPKNTFYVMNMNGEELVERSEKFILQQSRKEKLDQILKNII